MRRVVCFVIVSMLIFTVAIAEVDLSGMSFDELVELEHQVMMAIMESDGWQEVKVPQGVYIVGTDIPAGKWMLVYNGDFSAISTDSPYAHVTVTDDETTAVLELVDGQKVEIKYSSVLFTPFTGSLGFK